MKIAHLILAHAGPAQLQRLVERLLHKDADVYIHIDKRAAIQPFEQLQELPGVVFIQHRVKVYWGAYSIVEATLRGFETISQAGKKYDYINLLSGQDYPIQPINHIHRFLEENKGKAFMEFYPVATVWQEAIPRLSRYHLTHYRFAGKHLLEKWMNKLLPDRIIPKKMVAVGRSQWFTITSEHMHYILQFLQNNPVVSRFFKFTWGADELVFQTILYNSPYQKDMVNNNLRLIDWSDGGVSPKTFTIADASALMTSDKLYARKFGSNTNDPLLHLIDQQLLLLENSTISPLSAV
ncbi:MAG: glycosyl transferase [Sphingobacteriaceae bacterium]|nr:MAG: glycosyl transferase [Sphingobacteriaceae bacterium]